MSFKTSPWVGAEGKPELEEKLVQEKRKQPGVSFPSASKQEYLLIIRLDLRPEIINRVDTIRKGIMELSYFIDKIDRGTVRLEELTEEGSVRLFPLSKYNFTFTIGFGKSFFEKLNIDPEKHPRRIYVMPDHHQLGDDLPYVLNQTDIIIQLGSDKDFVNRWVFQNDAYKRIINGRENKNNPYGFSERRLLSDRESSPVHDIESAIENWVVIRDTHSGFQRMDGRNLMGFNDGVSNPDRLNNNVIWIPANDQSEIYPDGTYMVFQKIQHDLTKWRKLDVDIQEKWVGRSKATGLLLGTLPKTEDEKLATDCFSIDPVIQRAARNRLKDLLREQMDPEKEFFKAGDSKYENIRRECPVWSHVRKSNPRGSVVGPKRIIFRRGYLYMSNGQDEQDTSGLLFICFQRDIQNGFEYIKKNFLNNKNFPIHEAGKDALTDPPNLGNEIDTSGKFSPTRVLGGGYYFIPPIPNRNIRNIAEQFF